MRRALTLACVCFALAGRASGQTEIVLDATNTVVTAPMTLVEGVLHQPANTKRPESGTATITVRVPATGEYLLEALVDAPAADADSFYLDFDQSPTDPAAIWDIVPPAAGFRWRVVTRRGSGNTDVPEFDPMVFNLSAGEHRLIIAGRERARLKSVRLRPFTRPAEGTIEFLQQAYTRTQKQANRDTSMLPRAERSGPKGKEIRERRDREYGEQFATALRMAEANLGQPAGLTALDWLLEAHVSHYREEGARAVALLRQHYVTAPGVARSVAYLAHHAGTADTDDLTNPGARQLFDEVFRDNPDRIARGQALFGIAQFAKFDARMAEWKQSAEVAEMARRKTIELMEAVRRDYGDVAYLKTGHAGETLGEQATNNLRELRGLRLGVPAPEIEGRDLDGVSFKLSDYRGQVVMLVFWAAWCGPCIAAVPHEKEIVERFKGRPFVLIGVNGDGPLKDAQQAVTRHGIPWRSFWDGRDESISKAWNIEGWPTTYVIDHEGIIRQRLFLKESGLEPLVAAAEKKP